VQGKGWYIGFCVYPDIRPSDAYEAAGYAVDCAQGGNPVAELHRANLSKPIFEEAAGKDFESNKATWKNLKNRRQWLSTLERYVFPDIGCRRVDHIGIVDIL